MESDEWKDHLTEIAKLRTQLREAITALNFYADINTYLTIISSVDGVVIPPIKMDSGEKAREVLERINPLH